MACLKSDKGIIIHFLSKITGYSRQQVTRLIAQYKKTGCIKWEPCRNQGFFRKYTEKDIRLLAKADEHHDTPCRHAVKKLCERAYHLFNEVEYQKNATISVSHLYNLRTSISYQRQRRHFEKTQPRKVAIGD